MPTWLGAVNPISTILKKRYARRGIDKEEFDRRRRSLEG